VHVHRLKPYEAKPMPVGVPATFQFLDDFEPADEFEFDFETNSDRWEPDPSEPEQEWTVEDFQPRTSVPMELGPLPADLFLPRPQPKHPKLPSTKLPLDPAPAEQRAEPAAPPRAPPRSTAEPASPPPAAQEDSVSASEGQVAPDLPMEMQDLLRDLTSRLRELRTLPMPEDMQSELRIWRAQARGLNTLLELHLGPQHSFKIKTQQAPKAPLTSLRERLDNWVTNFPETFKKHIDALVSGRRMDAPRTLNERIRRFK
jgi:hypothetical protein